MFYLTLIKSYGRSFHNCADTETPVVEVSFKVSFLYWLSLLLNYGGGKFKEKNYLLTREIIH